MQNPELENEKKAKKPCSVWIMEWIETIVMAFVTVTIIFTLITRVITVDGVSMEPTYYNGDRVLATSLAGDAKQGDVVIIVHALKNTIIKRVVATEGQWVDFNEDLCELTVDGVPLKGETFGIANGITILPDRPGLVMDFPQQVPEGCVFVLGDNRGDSTDSRYISVGMVDKRNILGKVVFNLFPLSKMGPVG